MTRGRHAAFVFGLALLLSGRGASGQTPAAAPDPGPSPVGDWLLNHVSIRQSLKDKNTIHEPASVYLTFPEEGDATKEINGAIAEITKHKPTQYWVELFEANGVPCGPINTIDKVFADPQVQHLGIASPVHSETLGDIKLVASPINMTGVSKKIRSATADAGAHTDEVLASVGYTKEQLQKMRANGVI